MTVPAGDQDPQASGASPESVHVREYDRHQDGKIVHVSEYDRGHTPSDSGENSPKHPGGHRIKLAQRAVIRSPGLKEYFKDDPYGIGILPMPIGTGAALLPKLSPQVMKFAEKYGLEATSKISQNILRNLDMPVIKWLGKFAKGDWQERFPRQLLNGTVRDAIASGDSAARKIMTQIRFLKERFLK